MEEVVTKVLILQLLPSGFYIKSKVDEIMLWCNDDKKKITIISQNLYNYNNHRKKNIRGLKQVALYQNNYKADVYAFQEYPEFGRGKTFYTPFVIIMEKVKEA